MLAAMGLPGGGRAAITTRFSRHFHVVALPGASTDSMAHIFGTIHRWFVSTQAFPSELALTAEPVTDLILAVRMSKFVALQHASPSLLQHASPSL